jgi:Na+/phosphate symporter
VFLFSLGFILYGIAIVQAQVAPLIAGVCLALGAPLFWMGALFVSKGPLSNQVTEIGAVLFGLGLVMLGRRVLANTDTHGWLQSEAEAT